MTKILGGHEIITLWQDGQQIVIPNDMLEGLVCWYHHSTVHALGTTHLYTTIQQHFFHPKVRSEIQQQVKNEIFANDLNVAPASMASSPLANGCC